MRQRPWLVLVGGFGGLLLLMGPTRKSPNHLNLSLYTVDTHRTHILQKLNLHSVPS